MRCRDGLRDFDIPYYFGYLTLCFVGGPLISIWNFIIWPQKNLYLRLYGISRPYAVILQKKASYTFDLEFK